MKFGKNSQAWYVMSFRRTASCSRTNDRGKFMNGTTISAIEQVCGRTKGPKRHEETWLWNEGVELRGFSWCR